MAKKIRPVNAVITLLAIAAGGFAAGRIWISKQDFTAPEEPADKAAMAMQQLTEHLAQGNYDGLYDSWKANDTVIDSQESYENALKNKLGDAADLTWIETDNYSDEHPQYVLNNGSENLVMVDLVQSGDSFVPVIPLHGSKTVRIEVPRDMTIYAGGSQIDSSHIVESDVLASNFRQMNDDSYVPEVDIYELDGLLDEPALQDADSNELSVVKDVISEDLLVGEAIDDEDLKQTIIDAATAMAAFPAQDGSLSAVAAYADPAAGWYYRYSSLPNYWFYPHSVYEFSNQDVIAITSQSEDTAVAHVVFDYFADGGDYSRTWHVGYQLTMHQLNGSWYVASTAIDNELNPGTEPIE